ncbi:MAG: class I SAM-dependent methyltransferase [Clostridiales bacterium]|nr:class I SAM-dependent methyltransferase [Clostridiales bacterium]
MKRCLACGCELPQDALFVLKNAPASAQDIPDAAQVRDDAGIDLSLYQCEACGLVQFDCEPVPYYRDVIRAGGFTTTMTGLRRAQYRHLIETYHLEGKKFLEVGCGRGEFLKVLTEFPVRVYGMEHRDELVKLAQESGLYVWREFPDAPDQRLAAQSPFDVFLSFNFLEHQPRPDVMLRAIHSNLAEDGLGLVTVPSLEYILERESYYELIRDHIAYYTLDTLERLMERNGFTVLEKERVTADTLSVIVRKAQLSESAVDNGTCAGMMGEVPAPVNAALGSADMASVPAGMSPASVIAQPLADGFSRVTAEVARLTGELAASGKHLALWGASHQGFTLAATAGLAGKVEYIIDSAPFKQGRFAPASHIPIVAPDDYFEKPVDAILIVAPGYTEEIAGIIRARFGDVRIMTLRSNCIETL